MWEGWLQVGIRALYNEVGMVKTLQCGNETQLGAGNVTMVIPKPPDLESTFNDQQLHASIFQLPTFKYQLSLWTHIHPFRLRGGGLLEI